MHPHLQAISWCRPGLWWRPSRPPFHKSIGRIGFNRFFFILSILSELPIISIVCPTTLLVISIKPLGFNLAISPLPPSEKCFKKIQTNACLITHAYFLNKMQSKRQFNSHRSFLPWSNCRNSRDWLHFWRFSKSRNFPKMGFLRCNKKRVNPKIHPW